MPWKFKIFQNRQHIISDNSFSYVQYQCPFVSLVRPWCTHPRCIDPTHASARCTTTEHACKVQNIHQVSPSCICPGKRSGQSTHQAGCTKTKEMDSVYSLPRAHTQLMFVAPLMNGPTVSGLGHQHGEVHFFALDRHIATIYTYLYVNAANLLICDKASPTCSEQFVPFSMVVNNNKLKKLVPLKGPLPSFQSNSQNRDLSTAPQWLFPMH